jgi:hypothetical protein
MGQPETSDGIHGTDFMPKDLRIMAGEEAAEVCAELIELEALRATAAQAGTWPYWKIASVISSNSFRGTGEAALSPRKARSAGVPGGSCPSQCQE